MVCVDKDATDYTRVQFQAPSFVTRKTLRATMDLARALHLRRGVDIRP